MAQTTDAEESHFIINSSFEEGLTGWMTWGGVEEDEMYINAGEASVKILGGKAEKSFLGVECSGICQSVALLPYEKYTLGINIKNTEKKAYAQAGIVYNFNGKSYRKILSFENNEFSRKEFTFSLPYRFSDLYVYVINTAKNEKENFWVDDFVIKKGESIDWENYNNKINNSVKPEIDNNLLVNGGFEKDFDSWNKWSDESEISNSVLHSGKKSLIIKPDPEGDKAPGAGLGNTNIKLKPLTKYSLSAWAKYDSQTYLPGLVMIEYTTAGNKVEEKLEFTENWFLNKTLIFTTPADCSNVSLNIYKVDGSQNFYVDDIEVIQLSEERMNVFLDNKPISLLKEPLLKNSEILMDAEAINEILRGKYKWNPTQKVATFELNKKKVIINAEENSIFIDEKQIEMTGKIKFYDETFFYPVKDVLSAFGFWFGYNSVKESIYIYTKEGENIVERNDNSPKVETISTIDKNVLVIKIKEGEYKPNKIVPYVASSNDVVELKKDPKYGHPTKKTVQRNGKLYGYLNGINNDYISLADDVIGDKLNTDFSDIASSYRISDEAGNYIPVTNLWRKSKIVSRSSSTAKGVFEYNYYLTLKQALNEGETYTIDLSKINTQQKNMNFEYNSKNILSEAVHASQVGYRTDDTVKRAFLSIWTGTGGAYYYQDNLSFQLIDETTNKTSYTGKISLSLDKDKPEPLNWKNANQSYTNVYTIDFGEYKTPGTYRVYVHGVGCSYPFEISDTVWEDAFKIGMKGMYNMRGTWELNEPYSNFKRPTDHDSGKGYVYYQSKSRLMDTGNGIKAAEDTKDNFELLNETSTASKVEVGAGGYHDAGDWDRHVKHLEVTLWQLDIFEEYQDKMSKINLNIPESDNNIPDMLDEAMYAVKLYYDLQTKDGGIRGGVEYQSHPVEGEVSWMDSLKGYVYAPDSYSCYYYVPTVAKLSGLLRKIGQIELADKYLNSAIRAMQWGEEDYKVFMKDPVMVAKRDVRDKNINARMRDIRSLAALELYKVTNDVKWHNVCLEDLAFKDAIVSTFVWTEYEQGYLAYSYAKLSENMGDEKIKKNCKESIIADCKQVMEYIDGNGFNLGYGTDKGQPLILGFYSVPQPQILAHAYALTKDNCYIEHLQKAALYSAGANPMNTTFTVGLGKKWPQQPLHLDAWASGQQAPTGITIYGTWDLSWEHWANQWVYQENVPTVTQWPNNEGWFDAYGVPMTGEWTPSQTIGKAIYVWGVLAGR